MMRGKLLGRGIDRHGQEYTREIYGDRGFGPAVPFSCSSCKETLKSGDNVVFVEDGEGFCPACFDELEDAAEDYHCGVLESDWR